MFLERAKLELDEVVENVDNPKISRKNLNLSFAVLWSCGDTREQNGYRHRCIQSSVTKYEPN